MKKRVLAMLLALALAAALLPVAALAVDVTDLSSLQSAITNAANGTNTEIVLTNNITGSITIPANKIITLDLNGWKLTNTAESHTITVSDGATLTVVDNSADKTGTVDNVSHARGALYNNPGGTVHLYGGIFDRSREQGSATNNNGGNSWYTIKNFGTMTVYAGVTVQQNGTSVGGTTGKYSSLFANGWQNIATAASGSSQEPAPISGVSATLTIMGGTFNGGLNTVKNDDNGNLIINNGTFNNFAQALVQNHNVTTINGGTFNAGAGASYGVDNCGCAAVNDLGTLTINGGTFTGVQYGVYERSSQPPVVNITGGNFNGSTAAVQQANGSNADINISGGTFSGPISKSASAGSLDITGGTFNTDVTDYVDGATPYATLNGTYYAGTGNVQAAAASAPSGSTVTVLKGSVNLSAQEGVTVVNDASNITGTVTVGGRRLSPGAFYTVPYPPATHDDLLITRLPDGSNQPVQVLITLDRILSGPFGGHQFEDGMATLSIAPGQTLYIHQLPVGTNYTISLLDGTVVSGSALTGTILPGVDAMASFTALPGVTPDLPGGEIVEGEEEIVEPGEEEGDVQEGTEETPPEETVPEEGLEELPEEGEVPAEEPVDVPKTGDAAPSIGRAILLGLAVCAIALKKVRAK